MKPTTQTIDHAKGEEPRVSRFPITDYQYHSVALDGYNGRCARTNAPGFHTLSRDYFKTEATRDFLTEAIVFAAIMATAALPLLNGALAVLQLVRGGGV